MTAFFAWHKWWSLFWGDALMLNWQKARFGWLTLGGSIVAETMHNAQYSKRSALTNGWWGRNCIHCQASRSMREERGGRSSWDTPGGKSSAPGEKGAAEAKHPSCTTNSCLTFRGDCRSSEMVLDQCCFNRVDTMHLGFTNRLYAEAFKIPKPP